MKQKTTRFHLLLLIAVVIAYLIIKREQAKHSPRHETPFRFALYSIVRHESPFRIAPHPIVRHESPFRFALIQFYDTNLYFTSQRRYS